MIVAFHHNIYGSVHDRLHYNKLWVILLACLWREHIRSGPTLGLRRLFRWQYSRRSAGISKSFMPAQLFLLFWLYCFFSLDRNLLARRESGFHQAFIQLLMLMFLQIQSNMASGNRQTQRRVTLSLQPFINK